MNKKLLCSLLTLLSVMTSEAQTKVWDFLTNTTILPINFQGVPTATEDIVDDLGRFAHSSSNNFAKEAQGASTFADGYISNRRANMNGAGQAFEVLPTVRFFFFDVSSNCTIKVWARPQSADIKTLFISNAESILGSTTNVVNSGPVILEGTNNAGAKRIFIYCEDGGYGIYKIEVSGATVTTTIPMADWLLNVKETNLSHIKYYVKDRTVFLSNIDTELDILVYSITGSLVKTIRTSLSDMSFEIDQTGIYILKLSSSDGQKSIKLIVD
jgi:hypothetical protein